MLTVLVEFVLGWRFQLDRVRPGVERGPQVCGLIRSKQDRERESLAIQFGQTRRGYNKAPEHPGIRSAAIVKVIPQWGGQGEFGWGEKASVIDKIRQ